MAWENELMNIGTVKSSGDMSDHQYKAVQLSTANDADGAIVVATRGGLVDGIWKDNSTAATPGSMQVLGFAKVAAGDSSAMPSAITRGTRLVASSVGQAVPSTAAGQKLIGISYSNLGTGSTGLITAFLTIGAIST